MLAAVAISLKYPEEDKQLSKEEAVNWEWMAPVVQYHPDHVNRPGHRRQNHSHDHDQFYELLTAHAL